MQASVDEVWEAFRQFRGTSATPGATVLPRVPDWTTVNEQPGQSTPMFAYNAATGPHAGVLVKRNREGELVPLVSQSLTLLAKGTGELREFLT